MRFTCAAVRRLTYAAALWAAVSVFGQELPRTQVTDTLFNADGTLAEGSLEVSWPAFTTADGLTVDKNSFEVDIVDGVVTLELAPNEGAVPDGTTYQVQYRLRKGQRYTELWVVPQSASPVSISAIRVLSAPEAGVAVSMAQVSGLPAALDGKADKAATNTFSAPQILREDAPGTTNPLLGLEKNDGSAGIYFRLPTLSGDVTYTLPAADGAPNQALTADGAGGLFWSSAAGGAGSGSAYEVLQQGGTSRPQRTVANFASGFVVTDNSGQLRTDIAPDFGTTAGTVTEGDDSRLSDARTPLAHASSHASAGSDPITPLSIGALNRTNDYMVGSSPTDPVLKIQGATGQAAALQEWRDGAGTLAALVTPEGNGFFRELGISAPAGVTTVSEFFDIGGLKKFAFSATDGVLDVVRYDNAGAFLDRPLRVFRSGNIQTTATFDVTDANVGAGSLRLTGDYAELQSVAAPATPSSGFGRLFLDSSTGKVSFKKASGAVVSLEDGGGGGSGDVVGPASATDNAFARFDSTTGKLLQDSAATLDDNGFPTWGAGYTGGWARETGSAGNTANSSHYIYGGDVDGEPAWLGLQQGDASSKQETYLQSCVDGVDGRACLAASAPSADSTDWLVSQENNYCVDSVGTDAYACSVSPSIGAYATGHSYKVSFGTNNTGAATLALNGLSAITILDSDGSALADDCIVAGSMHWVFYDGTNMLLDFACPTGDDFGAGDPGSNGVMVRTAADTSVARTITGTASQVTVTNGDGFSGNPTLSLPATIDVDTSGNAATATALAANGSNCSAGNYPLGVDASGAVESCTADDDVPESGDFGNAADLDSDGGITDGAVTTAGVEAELKTRQWCKTLFDPDGLDETVHDIPSIWMNGDYPITVTDIWCEADAGSPVVNLQRDDGTPTDISSSDITCGTTPTHTADLAGAEDNVAADEEIDFDFVSKSSAPDRISICMQYTVD